MNAVQNNPARIVCLTEETVETLYLLGCGDQVVGVTGYAVRPPEARRKPKVSAFTSAKMERVLELHPDLVLGFSDLQADIARELIRAGKNVLVFNQRSVEEIFQMIRTLARIVDSAQTGEALCARLRADLGLVRESASRFPRRPRVFFEEWNDPLISGIRWVEELIEISGGEPVFPHLRDKHRAPDRVVQPRDVIAVGVDVVIASWCGKKVNKAQIRGREGWNEVKHIYEVKSTYILQPGPAALTEGVRQLHAILAAVAGCKPLEGLEPREALDPDLVFLPRPQ